MTSIELDIFSGRPNPVWTLSLADSQALAALLTGLPPAAAPVLPDLGYRGFVLSGGPSGALAGRWRIGAGTVSRGGQHFSDTRGAERWLFQHARAHGQGPLVDAIAPP